MQLFSSDIQNCRNMKRQLLKNLQLTAFSDILNTLRILLRRDGGIGRHKGLKIPRLLQLCRFKSGSRQEVYSKVHPKYREHI